MKSIKITIPEPCHEDWSKMTPEAKGRFCSSCEKVVFDMSVMTDNEIIKLVDSNKKMCGRFRNDQLERDMVFTIPLRVRKSSWAIAASLLVGLTFLSCTEETTVGDIEPVKTGGIEAVVTEDELSGQEDTLNLGCGVSDSLDNSKMVGQMVVMDTIISTKENTKKSQFKKPEDFLTAGKPVIHVREEPSVPDTTTK